MKPLIKNTLANTLAATGLTVVILALIGTLFGAKYLFISSVFQSLGVNFLIQLGLPVVRKYESNYFIVETLLAIGYVLLVLIPAGFLFDWYGNGTPLWIVILMGIVIYALGCAVDIMRINDDIKFINQKLKIRNGGKGITQ